MLLDELGGSVTLYLGDGGRSATELSELKLASRPTAAGAVNLTRSVASVSMRLLRRPPQGRVKGQPAATKPERFRRPLGSRVHSEVGTLSPLQDVAEKRVSVAGGRSPRLPTSLGACLGLNV